MHLLHPNKNKVWMTVYPSSWTNTECYLYPSYLLCTHKISFLFILNQRDISHSGKLTFEPQDFRNLSFGIMKSFVLIAYSYSHSFYKRLSARESHASRRPLARGELLSPFPLNWVFPGFYLMVDSLPDPCNLLHPTKFFPNSIWITK